MKRPIDLNRTSDGLQGPIIDWCNTLHNPTICGLELHPATSKPSRPQSVVISLLNGSKYRLQRGVPQKTEKGTMIPNVVHNDTIEQVIPSASAPSPLISIKFLDGHQPNLHFVLCVCYGARRNPRIFRASQLVADSDFFALAIILNVARKCVPRRVISPTAAVSQLESLWNDVYTSIQSQGVAFWEDTIAEQTKNLTRELIYRSARLEMPTVHTDKRLSLSAAAVARVEALAEKNESADLAFWDASWDRRWKEAWQVFKPIDGSATSVGARTMGSIVPETLRLSVDGRAPGRAAGRSLTSALLRMRDISPWINLSQEPVQNGKGKEVQTDEAASSSKSPNPEEHSICKKATRASEESATIYPGGSMSPVIWLGQPEGHEIQPAKDHKIWASQREIAVEKAWVAAWPRAVQQGISAAKKIQQQESDWQNPTQGLHEVPRQTSANSALHPGLAGAITAARTASRWLGRVSHTYSSAIATKSNREGSPAAPPGPVPSLTPHRPWTPFAGRVQGIKGNSTTEGSKTVTETVPIISSPLQSQISLAGASRTGKAVAPQEVSPTEPHPQKLPEEPQTNEASPPSTTLSPNRPQVCPLEDNSEAPSHQRTRSDDLRKMLRERMLPHKSEQRRDSEDMFKERVRERRYREGKEDAQTQAKQDVSLMMKEAKPSEADLKKDANEAWERMMELSSNLKHHIDCLADQEWHKLSTGRNLITSQIFPNDREPWKRRFTEAWEKAWKESWVSAWNATWNQAWHEAAAKGVEFGVELAFLDRIPNASRNGYEQLLSMDSYRGIDAIINEDKISQFVRLKRVFSTMKELYSLYESFQHSVPAIRDDCIEIMIWEAKTIKIAPTLASGIEIENTGTPTLKSHFQLQMWIRKHYFSQKSQTDPQLKNQLKGLFTRGIAEVWDSASSVYIQENFPLPGERE